MFFTDPRFREPRKWSNLELKKFARELTGSMVNVSAWRDQDKEGKSYRDDYFKNASDYWITNWKADAFGFQGGNEKEIFLDLEHDLPEELNQKFDVVFNHTTLEHIFDVQKAFQNLCLMSKDIVIVVLPFLQEQHGAYGDYWRFTPWCIKRLFLKNAFIPAYISVNDGPINSIYIFAIGVRNKTSVNKFYTASGNIVDEVESRLIGTAFCDRKSWLMKKIESLISSVKACIGK